MKGFVDSIKKQFVYYKQLGDKTFEQLTDEQLLHQQHDDSNSVSMIVKHLYGNMLSRWTNFRTEDGEKTWRNRDGEFESTISSRVELIEKWEAGWTCLFEALAPLTDEDLSELVYIRNQGHTIAEAINRQLAHYAYHVGQIVYIGKLFNDNTWKSLSIPRGNSKEYNQMKFQQKKQRGHFTDEFLTDSNQ